MSYIYLDGTVNYAKLGAENYDKKFDCWVVDFYPTREAADAMATAGLTLKKRFDDEGKMYVKLRRPRSKKMGEDIVTFDAPIVLLKTGEGTDGVPETEPFKGLIGNGTYVVAKVSVYGSKMIGHRLEGVRIDRLVKYERPDGPVAPKEARTRTAETPF